MNKQHDSDRALKSYERAFALDPSDARVFFELDQLYKKRNDPPAERLARLEQHLDLVERRDDLTLEYITLLNLSGRYEQALHLLTHHEFHPWEGGEGKVTGQYVITLVELAKRHLQMRNYVQAVEYLERARVYPNNLGEGKLPGAQENNVLYYLGCAYEGLSDDNQARRYFENASTGLVEPTSPMYYNDQPPDMIFYQGKAREKLGQYTAAQAIFQKLVDYGTQYINDPIMMDYFAVSLPDFQVFDGSLSQRHVIHCHYIMALGYLGLHQGDLACTQFAETLSLDSYHIGAIIHMAMV